MCVVFFIFYVLITYTIFFTDSFNFIDEECNEANNHDYNISDNTKLLKKHSELLSAQLIKLEQKIGDYDNNNYNYNRFNI